MSGLQVEAHKTVRLDATVRRNFAESLAEGVAYWINNYL